MQSRLQTIDNVLHEEIYLYAIMWFCIIALCICYYDRRKVLGEPVDKKVTQLYEHEPCGELMTKAEIPQHLIFCKARQTAPPDSTPA
jgi:hypothetical protein